MADAIVYLLYLIPVYYIGTYKPRCYWKCEELFWCQIRNIDDAKAQKTFITAATA